MLFNFWRYYKWFKPKTEETYLCTLDDGTVLDLYFRYDKVWVDIRRQRTIDGYKCYKQGREPMEYNRIYEDSLCIRDNVIAWKFMPKPFRVHKKKEKYGTDKWMKMDGKG